jgi:hypothetical protein
MPQPLDHLDTGDATRKLDRLVPLRLLARHRDVSERTCRNWARLGHLKLYRVRGISSVLVDIDEADAALDALVESGQVRPGYGRFGGVPVIDLVTEVTR